MIEAILQSLMPIFLIIGLGWGLRGGRFLPEGFFSGMNSLVFYIGLPALLLVKIATSSMHGGPALRILWVLLGATATVTAVAYLLSRILKLDGPGEGAFVQAAMRGNLAYIGLPVIFYAVTPAAGMEGNSIEAAAMLVLAPVVPIYNIACIVILTHGAGKGGSRPPLRLLVKRVISNPLLIACLLGMAIAWSGLTVPVTLVRTLQPLGQMALPLALLSIGASLSKECITGRLAPAVTAAVLKVVIAPLAGLVVARALGLSPAELRMALIFLACPTAVASYIMAEQLGADAALAGSAVMISTLLSFFSLAAIVALV